MILKTVPNVVLDIVRVAAHVSKVGRAEQNSIRHERSYDVLVDRPSERARAVVQIFLENLLLGNREVSEPFDNSFLESPPTEAAADSETNLSDAEDQEIG